jgi:hypothetical protein
MNPGRYALVSSPIPFYDYGINFLVKTPPTNIWAFLLAFDEWVWISTIITPFVGKISL